MPGANEPDAEKLLPPAREDGEAPGIDGAAEARNVGPPNGRHGSRDTTRNLLGFWLLGVLNNSAYVIMNAGAKDISPGAVGFHREIHL